MKIQKINQPFMEQTQAIVKDEAAQSHTNSVEFKRQLSELTNAQHEQYVKGLIDDISAQGALLAKRADLREFHKYKEMIRSLINETVSNGFAFSKFRKFDARGRNKTFAIIQQINTRLDEMTAKLLEEEADHIELLRSVDDIRGMLVDLLM